MITLTNAEGFTLRPMTEADIDAVYQLETSTNPNPWTKGILHNSLTAGDNCWLLEQDQHLAGYGVTMISIDEGTILNIAIAPTFQRQGLGHKLLQFLVTDAKQQGANVMFLEVRKSNVCAIDLYLQNDFSEVGIRKNYYPAANGGCEDAIVMMRDLSFEDG